MNLVEIQPWVAGLIRSNATINALGDITAADMAGKRIVLEEDGTWPKTPYREELLSTKGLCLTVWQIESGGLEDSSRGGAIVPFIYVPIVVEENVKVNRASGGTGIKAEEALQLVLTATLGKRYGSPVSQDILIAFDPPFDNLGRINGVQKIVANIGLKTTIAP